MIGFCVYRWDPYHHGDDHDTGYGILGKPATRRHEADGGVSFHHHEVVGAKMVRKLVMWKTNKEDRSPDFPTYVVHLTDYSPNRQVPLQREIRVSSSQQQMNGLWDELETKSFVKGWEDGSQADQLGIFEVGDRLRGVGELPFVDGGFEQAINLVRDLVILFMKNVKKKTVKQQRWVVCH